jgi:uncharacterized OsmC-like protein
MGITKTLPKLVNGVNVANLSTTIDAIKAAPAMAKFKFQLRNQWLDASQNTSSVSAFHGGCQKQYRQESFILRADEPEVLLGVDTAPNPVEHLLHALVSCLTTSMVYHAAARGIQIDVIESSLEGDIDLHGFLDLDPNVRKGYQGIRVNFKIKADVPDEQLQKIVELGTGHSPVFDSHTKGVAVSVVAERL